MCGIIGYIGDRPCVEIVFQGLRKLEYRGYDSAGISVLTEQGIQLTKSSGKLDRLASKLHELPETASVGMGHTRWATHGPPTTSNAHPHSNGRLAIIHNGILENYSELKKELTDVKFDSETDTEVILHLVENARMKEGSIHAALLKVLPRLEGAFAIGVLCVDEPDRIYIVKHGAPAVVGIGKNENFFASDALALSDQTNQAVFLEDGEFACVKKDSVELFDFSGKALDAKISQLRWDMTSADKRGFRHYMLKEIYDQPAVVANTIQRLSHVNDSHDFALEELGLKDIDLQRVKNIHLVACGTAFYAATIARYFLENHHRVPVSAELASEYRYRRPYVSEETLLVAVSQSGETADTLACVKHAKKSGAQVLSVCNVPFSSIPRASTAALYMEAGPEIGVASTKAFTSMVLSLYVWSLASAKERGVLSEDDLQSTLQQLREFPPHLDQVMGLASKIEHIITDYYEATNCLFIGRGKNSAIAYEGALKLKEISYIHAEGYAGGELKHGPIALIDRHMPVVAIVSKAEQYEKMLTNIQEVHAREGWILGIGDEHDERLKALCRHYIECPQIEDDVLQTILNIVPLQFFAYYIAVKRGTDVDQPRNLAKSVTVE